MIHSLLKAKCMDSKMFVPVIEIALLSYGQLELPIYFS